MSKVFLIEDHDQALEIWRRDRIKGLDLVHVDAHPDLSFFPADPIEHVFREARTKKELKRGILRAMVFKGFTDNFDKQINVGNYIYPAMREGLIEDFYWVVPGGFKEFKDSTRLILNLLRTFAKRKRWRLELKNQNQKPKGIISAQIAGRKFIICILEKLPFFSKKVLLDIDIDFLVIDSYLNSRTDKKIGLRKPWIAPKELAGLLKKKIKQPQIITIAYSANGGYAAMKYRYFADALAYDFAPRMFKEDFRRNYQAAFYFNLFEVTGKKIYYEKAIRLNPIYRRIDNNYGPLYFTIHRFLLAEREFLRILRVDPKNPACLFGLGSISLQRHHFKEAKQYFLSVLKTKDRGLFANQKEASLLGLAKAEISLGNLKQAKKLLFRYKYCQPLKFETFQLLGSVFEKEQDFRRAAKFYVEALRLGGDALRILPKLLKKPFYLQEYSDIIKKISSKKLKNWFLKRGLKKKWLKIKKILSGLKDKSKNNTRESHLT